MSISSQMCLNNKSITNTFHNFVNEWFLDLQHPEESL